MKFFLINILKLHQFYEFKEFIMNTNTTKLVTTTYIKLILNIRK